MWRNDDVVVPRRRREVVSNVYIDAIVGITTDETIAFDIADDDLCAAALSCDANDVDLRHPLHPLVDAWEYIVGSTMYGKQDRTQGVGGAGEASTRTTTKTETFPGKGGVSRGAGGGIALGRIPNDNQPRRGRGGQPQHRGKGGQLGRQGRERGGGWADSSSPFAIVDACVGEPKTAAARAALALHILTLAMPNARAVHIVNSSTWERNGGGRGGKSVA
jgi:hypothetical protein